MTTSLASTDLDNWNNGFVAARADLPDPPWLRARREAAIASFRSMGFPSRRSEDWQHTDLGPVTRTVFRPTGTVAGSALDRAAPLVDALPPVPAAARRVFVNGHPAPALARTHDLPDGVEVIGLAEILGSDSAGADLEPRLARLVDGDGHPFAALNTALWTDGVLVRVRAGVHVERPIHLVFLAVGPEERTAVHPRVLVVLEAESRLSVVETWTGSSTVPWLSNTVVEVWLDAGARFDLLEVQHQPRTTLHFRNLHVRQARDSRFAATCLSLGATIARSDVKVHLDGPGAECRLDGLTIVSECRHADHVTLIDHARPHGTSRQLYKGILDDEARAAFSGRILVQPHAQKTDARQVNHNVLLSHDAIANSKPQLEILADDVKCAHGATMGQLDEDAIFYLRSRGIDETTARTLLLRAFAAEVPARIEHEDMRTYAQALLERWLPSEA